MTPENLKIYTERLETDDKFLIYVVGLLIEFDKGRHTGQFKNANFKALWAGHVVFMDNVKKWWDNKNYLTQKQHDALVKVVKKYLDRIQIIFDTLDEELDNTTGSEIPIFSLNEFNDTCPACGNQPLTMTPVDQNLIYLCNCKACGFQAQYVREENSTEVGDNNIAVLPDNPYHSAYISSASVSTADPSNFATNTAKSKK